MSRKLVIPKASNKDIIAFFKDVLAITGAEFVSYQLIGGEGSYSFASEGSSVDELAKNELFTITDASLSLPNYHIRFSRGSGDANPNYSFDNIDIGKDTYHPEGWKPDDERAINLSMCVNKHFVARKGSASILFRDPKLFEEVINSHQAIIARLEDSLATVGERLTVARVELENELKLSREKLEAEHKLRLDNLDEEKQDLEKRRKELDDRDNTHARRQIRADLKKRIEDHAKSFSLTDGTRTLRIPIHILTWIGLAALGGATYYFGADINHMVSEAAARDKAIGATEVVVLALKPLGLTVAFLGLLTWYLRWMNRWFERHSEAEFQLKQFELDVDRASWVVETALEWRQEQQAPMPDHLIESISRNLFSRSEKDEAADMHPADYLASALLGRASGLKLKLPGADLEYDGKALKEAKQTADKAKSS
ncbi:hypothetical protein [Azospirillum palustre]